MSTRTKCVGLQIARLEKFYRDSNSHSACPKQIGIRMKSRRKSRTRKTYAKRATGASAGKLKGTKVVREERIEKLRIAQRTNVRYLIALNAPGVDD